MPSTGCIEIFTNDPAAANDSSRVVCAFGGRKGPSCAKTIVKDEREKSGQQVVDREVDHGHLFHTCACSRAGGYDAQSSIT